MLSHEDLESRLINSETALTGQKFGEIKGKSLLVVESERHLSRDSHSFGRLVFKKRKSLVERLVKGLLLTPQRFGDEFLSLPYLGERVAHDG